MKSRTLRIQFMAAASIFLMNGIIVGAWFARISLVREQTHLSVGELGFAFIFGTIGAVLTMGVGGWLGGRLGSHVMAPIATFACGGSLVLIAMAWDFWSLVVALLFFGIAQGTMDELRKMSDQQGKSLEDIFLQLTGGNEYDEVLKYLED